MENVIKQGYLRKAFPSDWGLSGLLDKIDPNKWFVFLVREGKPFLEYYDKDTDVFSSEPVNSFDLSSCQKVTYSFIRNARVHSFNIVLSDRVIDLASTSRDLMISWCETLESTLERLGILTRQDHEHVYSFCPAVVNKGVRGDAEEKVDEKVDVKADVDVDADVDVEQEGGAAGDYSVPEESIFGTFGAIELTRQKMLSEEAEREEKSSLSRKMSSISNASEESDYSGDFVSKEFFTKHRRPTASKISESSGRSIVKPERKTLHLGSGLSKALEDTNNNQNLDLDGDILDDGYSELATWLERDSSFGKGAQSTITVSTADSPFKQKIGSKHIQGQGASCDVSSNEKLVVDLCSASSIEKETCLSSISEVCEDQNTDRKQCGADSHPDTQNLYSAFPSASVESPPPSESSSAGGSGVTVVSFLHDPPPRTALSKPIPKKRTSIRNSNTAGVKPFQNWERFESESPVLATPQTEKTDNSGTSFPPLPPRFDSLPSWGSVSMDESVFRQSHERSVPRIPSPDLSVMSQSLIGSLGSASGSVDDVPPLPPRLDAKKGPNHRCVSTSGMPPPLPTRKTQSFRIQRPITSPPNFLGESHSIPEQSGQEVDETLVRRPDRQLSMRMRVERGQGTHTVISLKHNQVDILRGEMLSAGVAIELTQKSCRGLALVDVNGKVWIAGWNWKDFPRLHSKFHVGDELLTINTFHVENAATGMKMMKHAGGPVELVVRRIPHAQVFEIRRVAEGQSLGIKREGGTGEIVYVDPNGLAANNGLPAKAESILNPGFPCNWYFTEINSRPVSLFFKDLEILHRLNAVGLEISFVVQPSDFVFEIKKQLQKKIKSYKNYLPH